jgi:hypothetical protein
MRNAKGRASAVDALTDARLSTLAASAKGMRTALGDHELDHIADLALRIMQGQTRAAGGVMPGHMQRTYGERSDSERQGMRSAVANVICALVLLEIIDQPGS